MVRKQNYFGQVILGVDLAVVIGTYLAAHWIREWMWFSAYPVLPITRVGVDSWIVTVVFTAWVITGRYFNLYNPITYKSVSRVLAASFKAQMLAAVLMLNAIFVLRGFRGVSRALLFLLVLFSFISSAVEKLVVVVLMKYRWKFQRHATGRRVLLVGNREDAESYLKLVREHPEWNLDVVGVVSPSAKNDQEIGVSGDLPTTAQQ